MRGETYLRGIGVICLLAGYLSAASQGINGLLFTFFSNAVIMIIFITPSQARKLIDKWLKKINSDESRRVERSLKRT